MLRKCVCFLGAACLMMTMGLPAKAEMQGSIQVVPQCGGEAVMGGNISVYRIGSKLETGYQITDGLANWIVTEEEIWLKDFYKEFEWNLEPERSCLVEETSGALFADMPEGLYLVTQEKTAAGFSAFHSFLVCIPDGEEWNVLIKPKLIRIGESPDTGDHPAPIIGAMGIGLSVAVLMVLADQRKK